MKITRVVRTGQGCGMEKGRLVSAAFVPDQTVRQEDSGELAFLRDGSVIEGRAEASGAGGVLLRQVRTEMKKKDVIRFVTDGNAIVEKVQTVDGERTVVRNAAEKKVGEAWEAEVIFETEAAGQIFGLGQHEDGVSDYRGTTQYLYQNNMQIPMPFFLSAAGYGVFFDAGCLMVWKEQDGRITVTLDAAQQIDYYVIADPDPKKIIAALRKMTGHAAMLPRWAMGYIQSRERYCSQEELLQIAEQFRSLDIPVSCLVQDWQTWKPGLWGDKHLDHERYPDLKAAVDRLHEMGTAFMFSVWPNINFGSEDNEEMLRAGKLYANLSTYDAFDEEARRLYWKQCEREIFAAGTDAWWCDSSEPFTPDWGGSEKRSDEERYELTKKEDTRYMDAREANLYALMHAKGIWENQRQAQASEPDSARRVVNLTRSGSPGIQSFGAVLWSGDISANWETLRNQVVECQQMAASGIPWWTLDIGAFFVRNNNRGGKGPWFWNGDYDKGTGDAGYRELYTRWLQFGAFLPLMRSHGTDTPREPWFFGGPGTRYYDTILKYIRLRYRLAPYFYSLVRRVCADDAMLLKPLYFDYPAQEEAASAADEYLFGDFLVCPVTHPVEYGPESAPVHGDPSRPVFLPAGDDWYDAESGEWLAGGRTIQADAPLEKMPLYIRAGSILPVAGEDQTDLYHEWKPEQMQIDIYAGKDAAFTLYLDKGNGYGFEKGEYAEIPLRWTEEERRLYIGKAQGSYALPRQFSVTVRFPDGTAVMKECGYDGGETTLQL